MSKDKLLPSLQKGLDGIQQLRASIESKETRPKLLKTLRPYVKSELVYKAFEVVDRANFAPPAFQHLAYSDEVIPLGKDSSISQPSVIAEMIEALGLTGNERVLEVGTASGYTAALLSFCAKEVDTIENNPDLAQTAQERLATHGYKNVTVYTGNGILGIPERALFDTIIVTAAAEKEIPPALIEQIKVGGRIVIPIGKVEGDQNLVLGVKQEKELIIKQMFGVRFVPLVGLPAGN
ncbi:MAG: protein-L-isoaspartate(D-aspartate) O-methyltransferase [Candidatus Levyibacteriota bacterium]|jgi:protein-L-isoaspartate(D-aspartate) O-methyltransferase